MSEANDRPSAASRWLGLASLLFALGPPLAIGFVFAHFIARGVLTRLPSGIEPLIGPVVYLAPPGGALLGLAGVCWRGRASLSAVAGLFVNLAWAGTVLAMLLFARAGRI